MIKSLTAMVLLVFSFATFAVQEPIEFDTISVDMGEHSFSLEYAQTAPQRIRGLMFRDHLCDDCGMVFAFSAPRVGSIWMKNTRVPLDLAYVDENGFIANIFQLAPFDLTPVRSTRIVKYAIEMNQGWFAKHDIKEGDKIDVHLKD